MGEALVDFAEKEDTNCHISVSQIIVNSLTISVLCDTYR